MGSLSECTDEETQHLRVSAATCPFSRADKGADASHEVAASAVSSVNKEFASEIRLRYEKRDAQIAAEASTCASRHEQRTERSRVRCTTAGVLQLLPSTGSPQERCAVSSRSSLMHDKTRAARRVQPCEMHDSRCSCQPTVRTSAVHVRNASSPVNYRA